MKKVTITAVYFLLVLFLFACSSSKPVVQIDPNQDQDVTAVQDESQPQDETNKDDSSKPDEDIPASGLVCKNDSECQSGNICVPSSPGSTDGTCQSGCKSDGDCSSPLKCNTSLGRCVNTVASEGACSAARCVGGCCIAGDGLRAVQCAKAGSTMCVSLCAGPCKQGEVCMKSSNGNYRCVSGGCTGDAQCTEYNSHIGGGYVCTEDAVCGAGGTNTTYLIKANSCIPAGEKCSESNSCCSGQPCIQGYCY